MTNKTRGTIIQVPGATPGIIVAEGKQYPFVLEGIWMAPVAPALQQKVEIDIDETGRISAINVIGKDVLAKENLEDITKIVRDNGGEFAKKALPVFAGQMQKMSPAVMFSSIVYLIAFFFLNALVIRRTGDLNQTLLNMLGLEWSNESLNSSFGLLSLIGLLCALAPWGVPWLRSPFARFLNLGPLVTVVLAFFYYRRGLHALMEAATGAFNGLGGSFASSMADEVTKRINDSISLGFGFYVCTLTAIIIAVFGMKSRND